MKKTICVDFDGVIHEYSGGWRSGQIYDPPVPGAIEWLLKMDDIYDLAIYSSRSKDPTMLKAMEHWLSYYFKLYNLGYVRVSSDPNQIAAQDRHRYRYIDSGLLQGGTLFLVESVDQTKITFPTQKPAAWLTIDDRAICFKGVFPTTEQIDGFKPWILSE